MRTKKNLVIGVLCLTLVFMGLGYSLFSTTLNITGSSQGSGSFDVKITNVEVDSNNTTSGATNTMDPIGNDYAVTETTLSATFNAPGDYITYNITVTNRGSIDAAISVETNMLDSTDSYELSCTVTEGTEIAAGEYITFPCRMKFKESVDSFSNVQTAHMSVRMRSMQKTTYTPPENENDIPDYIINNDGVLLYSNIKTSSVTVPDSYNGKTITAINTNAFKNVGADGLFVNDQRGANSSLKAYPFRDLTQEELEFFEENGIQVITLTELLNINLTYNTVFPDSGGIMIIPANFADEDATTNLTSVNLSNMTHLREIYIGAFYSDSTTSDARLQSVVFPSNGALTHIGNSAFVGNELTNLSLPNTLTVIDDFAFVNNSLTGALTIPSSVTSIGQGAFCGQYDGSTNQITSVSFGNNSQLQTIGNYAFQDNALTGTLTIPASVTSIGDGAFNCSSDGSTNQITSLVFESDSHLQSIGNQAFSHNSLTGTLTIPASVTSIGRFAFEGDSDSLTNQIATLIFENNSQLQTIGELAFCDNALTGTLTIPSSVTTIGHSAFRYNSLVTVYLGSNIEVMEPSAFADNTINNNLSLTDIYIDMTETVWNSTVMGYSNPPTSITNYTWHEQGTTVHFNQN